MKCLKNNLDIKNIFRIFVKNNKMVKSDLTQLDGMYYVGHLIDIDGSGYVDEETAELILLEYNNGVQE